jgi:hypothetical protein
LSGSRASESNTTLVGWRRVLNLPCGEARIIRQRRADAHTDGVGLSARQRCGQQAALLAGDPLRIAAGQSATRPSSVIADFMTISGARLPRMLSEGLV